jgi:hypothetical protein
LLPPSEPDENEEQEEGGLNWGEVYTELLCQTSLGYEEIGERTIPQIIAILQSKGKFIASGLLGIPGIAYESSSEPDPDKEHTVDEAMAIAALFSGFG